MEENINNNTETQETETKTYTEDEVLALIQSETDKRVSQALNTQKKKYEKQISLSKLDDEAREKAEKDDRIAELEQKLAQMTIESNRSELKSTLGARGLDPRFADLLNITDNPEDNQKVISDFDKIWKAAINAEIKKRISSNSPKHNSTSPSEMTKESYNKMSLSEQSSYIQAHPEFKQTISTWYN